MYNRVARLEPRVRWYLNKNLKEVREQHMMMLGRGGSIPGRGTSRDKELEVGVGLESLRWPEWSQ